MLLRERGIELIEQSAPIWGPLARSSRPNWSPKRQHKAAGTMFGQNMPRLVQLGEFRLDAFLDGVLLIFTHRDVPGIIGTVGTIFGAHKVNIAQMAVGRASHHPGGEAIGVLNLDTRPPAAALKEVASHPDITSLSIIELPAAGELPTWLIGSTAK